MQSILRRSWGEHGLKVAIGSNFRPEKAEKWAPQFFGRTRLTQLYLQPSTVQCGLLQLNAAQYSSSMLIREAIV